MRSPSQMTIIFVLENNIMCYFAFKLEFIFIYMHQSLIGLGHLGKGLEKKKTFGCFSFIRKLLFMPYTRT